MKKSIFEALERLNKDLNIKPGLSLAGFLSPKLGGSTLTVRNVSDEDLYVESDEIVQIHIGIDRKEKKVKEELFSPKWNRRITVQEIDGSDFLELQAEEEFQKENLHEIAEDLLLAFDLIGSWAKANKLTIVEQKLLAEDPDEIEKPENPRTPKVKKK